MCVCDVVLESLLNLIWINIDKLIIINSDYVHIFKYSFVVNHSKHNPIFLLFTASILLVLLANWIYELEKNKRKKAEDDFHAIKREETTRK